MPGKYSLDLYVNQLWVSRTAVVILQESNGDLKFCLQSATFKKLGIAKNLVPADDNDLSKNGACLEPVKIIPDSTFTPDLTELRADLTVPQIYMDRHAKGYVDPSEWDSGINAAYARYTVNMFNSQYQRQSSQQLQGSLNTGLNLGAWRLRHNGSYSFQKGDNQNSDTYTAVSTYAQRDLTGLKSQLTLGEYYTPGEIFDSVPFTGVLMASDDRMLPDSQRGFAPVIRGVAETNAKVSIYQSGNLLYDTTVPPGPFALDDLYNTGYAGDLNVTITEADGRQKTFIVPYTSVAQLIRPGTSRFSVAAGEYRSDYLSDTPRFLQATFQRGLSNRFTGYTGSIIAEKYMAAQGGVAVSTGLGAIAFDMTHARANGLPRTEEDMDSRSTGESYRVSYSKLLERSQTNLTMAAYEFSSSGYLSFDDYARFIGARQGETDFRQRRRFQVNVTQPLGDRGNLYLTGSAQSYWGSTRASDTTYQVGYSNSFKWGSFNLSASRTHDRSGEDTHQYMASFSIPLGTSASSPYLSSSLSLDGKKNYHVQNTVSGTGGERNQMSYSAYGARDSSSGSKNDSYGASVQYNASKLTANASLSKGEDWRQENVGLSGTVVAHSGGIVFTQSQGETLALVEAQGATGAKVTNEVGAEVDSSGYAVVSGLTPYRKNEVTLDPAGMSEDTELEYVAQKVAPRAGAIVKLKYPTRNGKPILIRFLRPNNERLPIGADVIGNNGDVLAPVGQANLAFVRGISEKGALIVKWGDNTTQTCRAIYRSTDLIPANENAYAQMNLNCESL